jgi:hypothetical protein
MKISNQRADEIARAILANNKKEVDELYKKITDKLTIEYKKQLPEAILECFNDPTLSDFINSSKYLHISNSCFGRNYYVDLDRELPAFLHQYCIMELPTELESEILKLKYEFEDAKKEYDKLFREVYALLCSLRTSNAIVKNFPQAIPYLPNTQKNEVAINIEHIVQKIKVVEEKEVAGE